MVKMPNEGPSIFSKKSWWGKRTKLEKVLLFFFSLAIICSVCLAVTIFRKFTSGFNHVDLCQTNGCVTSAAKVIQNMNTKANPCEDFYEFACGKYTENSHIPDDKVSVNTFDEIGEKYSEHYRTILEKPVTDDEIIPFKYAKKLYRMCMNSSKIEEEDFKIFKKMLKDFGGWPVLEGNKWNEMNFDWKETQYRFRKAGFHHTQLIYTYVGLDAKNSTKRIFIIDQPYGGFTKILKKGFNSTIVKAYYDYLVDIAILYGADKVEASKDMMQYMEFKIDLAKILVDSEGRRNESAEYNPMTIRELQVRFPSIPWLQYINTKLEPFVTLTYDDVVIVSLPQYIEKMEKLLSVTPKRTIANYLFTTITEHQHFNDEMRKKYLDFSKIAYGINSYPPKWKRCIYAGGLYLARASMYVREYMKNNSKQLLGEIITDIKTTFIESLKKNSWMDHKTKKKAIQKAELMGSYVGYPDQLLDDDEIKEHYEGLVIHEDSMLKTSIAMSLWYRNKYLKQYYEPYDKNDWKDKVFPTVVNAFYSWHENNIQIPPGILNQPFFDSDRPKYLNYGAMGYIIGHEIIHGFDDMGKQYDKDGNLFDWWETEANKSFHEKAQCIVQQYANLTNEKINMTLNGINTQGENIADNGGIKLAYVAYQKWLQRNKPEPQLPGLKFTPQQLFWIAAASNWCSKVRPEMEKLAIMNDYHSPNYYRVIVPFINSGYFAKDFNCPLGSKMNPKYKCRVW